MDFRYEIFISIIDCMLLVEKFILNYIKSIYIVDTKYAVEKKNKYFK